MPRVHRGPLEGVRETPPLASDPATAGQAPQAQILGLQQSIGNHAVAALVQGQLARQPVAQEKAPAGAGEAVSSRVVKKDIQVVGKGQLAATLGLPPHTVPPGAESNPDFVASLFGPDASAYRLEEVHGLPSEIVNALPEGELVEVSAIHMPAVTKTVAAAEGVEHAVEKAAARGNEAAKAIEHSKVFRHGNRVFKAVSYGYALIRIWDAPAHEKLEVAGEEATRIGSGALGARGGVALALVLGVETGGVALLVWGALGAVGGEWVGEKAFEGFMNLLHAPEMIAEAAERMIALLGELADAASALQAPGQFVAGAIGAAQERLSVDNWDLRYLPAGLQADVRLVGSQLSKQLAVVPLDAFLGRLNEPLSAFGVSADAAARIAASASATKQAKADPLAMRPLEFVALVQRLGLAFVQNPDYLGGLSGRWDDEAALHVRLEPLVRDRAEANPANWNVSAVPAVNLDDGRDVDLGPAIVAAGDAAWARLGKLSETQLPAELAKPLKALGLTRKAAEDISDAVNGMRGPRIISLHEDTILESTPAQLVTLLRQFDVPITFAQEPAEIARLALRWVRAGFQPW